MLKIGSKVKIITEIQAMAKAVSVEIIHGQPYYEFRGSYPLMSPVMYGRGGRIMEIEGTYGQKFILKGSSDWWTIDMFDIPKDKSKRGVLKTIYKEGLDD